jgi:4-hydroxybenzoate polyprenyltransferase
MFRIGRRLLPILQLTRMALVFTALADSESVLLLWIGIHGGPFRLSAVLALAMISIGLYGFGVSLNDIIDRRRDAQIAAYRPLPSGRIGVVAAHIVCAGLLGVASIGALIYANNGPGGTLSLALFGFTLALIVFYDFAGKYLVAPGFLTLGFIRFFHAALPAPSLAVFWQPLLLLNHMTLVSAMAYRWEQRRPPLTKRHWWSIIGLLAAVDALLIGAVAWRRQGDEHNLASVLQALSFRPALIPPAAALLVFLVVAQIIRRRNRNARQAGQTLLLAGFLWLIVYDASFVAGYVGLLPAAVILSLLPIAYLSLQVARGWTELLSLTQRPQFKRVEV